MTTRDNNNRPVADFIVHNLSSAVVFPNPFRGGKTPAGWETEELKNVSIASYEGRIVWIGPADKLSDSVCISPDPRFYNGEGLLAVPGFVDSHTHFVYAGDRSDEF